MVTAHRYDVVIVGTDGAGTHAAVGAGTAARSSPLWTCHTQRGTGEVLKGAADFASVSASSWVPLKRAFAVCR